MQIKLYTKIETKLSLWQGNYKLHKTVHKTHIISSILYVKQFAYENLNKAFLMQGNYKLHNPVHNTENNYLKQ